MTPQADHLSVDIEGHVATVWLDRPEKLNALARSFWVDFPNVIAALGTNPEVRAIVIAGRGKAFTAGLDLAEFAETLHEDANSVESRLRLRDAIESMQDAFSSLAECPQPVIAAVHGYCIGAGVDMITACDIRLASADAVFSIRETRLGMVADVGTLQRLPRIVDPGRVAELVYTGKDFDATEALEMGLVTHVYADADAVHKEAVALAGQIAANSPLVVQGAKHVLRHTENMSIADALHYMALYSAAFLSSDDLREAVGAHLEKRPPKFTGT